LCDTSERTHEHNMKVVLAIECSEPGGAENLVVLLGDRLRAAGHEPIIVCHEEGWLTDRARSFDLPIWIVPQAKGLALTWPLRFARRLRNERIDIVHSHEFGMNVYASLAAALARIPFVGTIHGKHRVAEKRRRILAYQILRRCGLEIVAVSRDLAEFLSKGFGLPLDAFHVIHPGIPLEEAPAHRTDAETRKRARTELGIPLDGALAVAVGSLFPVKDHPTLLKAVASLPGTRLAIAGEGSELQALEELTNALQISERVHLLGLRADVDRVLRSADVFCQPSLSEGLPLSIIEAMAWGLPVVATRVGGIPEVVDEGGTGYLVPPGDPAALARGIERVLSEPLRAEELGRSAMQRAHADFSLEKMVDAYVNLYERRLDT
jgi:glycosyltransferase involved in cell wall biosynthesis